MAQGGSTADSRRKATDFCPTCLACFRNGRILLSIKAKIIRASLLPIATATSLKGLVSTNYFAHVLRASVWRLRW